MKTQTKEEIADIKRKQRELADRLEALEKEESEPKPQQGEVWRVNSKGGIALIGKIGYTYLKGGYEPSGRAFASSPDWMEERLGTFDEVYVERSKVKEEYVSKGELFSLLVRLGNEDLNGYESRMKIRKWVFDY